MGFDDRKKRFSPNKGHNSYLSRRNERSMNKFKYRTNKRYGQHSDESKLT